MHASVDESGLELKAHAQGMNSCRLPLSLPPDPVDELTDPGSQFTNWNPHVMSSTVWAYENFLQVPCPAALLRLEQCADVYTHLTIALAVAWSLQRCMARQD